MIVRDRKHLLLVFGLVYFAGISASWGQQETEGPRTVKMTVYAAAAPVPALQYSLLPEFLQQKPGNALLYYHMALQLMPDSEEIQKYEDKEWEWMDQLPKQEAIGNLQNYMNKYNQSFEQLGQGALREHCEWELPLREPGVISMVLPSLGKFRSLGKKLGLQVKVQSADGDFNGALRTMQNGFAYARHMSEAGTLIHDLVGHAIASDVLGGAELYVQEQEAPNLYWALSGLPKPFIDIRYAIGVERVLLQIEFPELRNIENMNITRKQIIDIYKQLFSSLSEQKIELYEKELETVKDSKVYVAAKKSLIEQGLSKEKVESMEALQVVFIYKFAEYVKMRDEMFKWFNAPYWQARINLKKMEMELEEKLKHEDDFWSNSFYSLLPALDRAYLLMAKLDRQIAMLRCVEAIRMYAAGHGGEVPQSLQTITEVPIPIDPVTGKDFVYKLEEGKVIIEGPAPSGAEAEEGLRYELTIKVK